MPSIKDVAKIAGVSPTTVSRVLNNRGYLSNEIKQKVYNAMKQLHYQPNQIARALHNRKSNLFAVIVPDSSNPFFAELVQRLEEKSHDSGYRLVLCNSLSNAEKEHEYLKVLQGLNIDGLIVCSHLLQLNDYESFPFPIVSFEKALLPSIPIVSSDNYKGGLLATRHLIEKGCKYILHISGPLDDYTLLGHDRFLAFSNYCEINNLKFDVIKTEKRFNFNYYLNFLSENVKDIRKYDGVFCSNDLLAYAYYCFAVSSGVKVPEECKIIGFDNSIFTKILQFPRITTIAQNTDKIADELISNLISQQSNKSKNVKVIVDVNLVEGTTT